MIFNNDSDNPKEIYIPWGLISIIISFIALILLII